MGYSTSIRAFNRVRNYLDEMRGNTARLSWRVPDPGKTAYQIREGIKVAKLRTREKPDEFRDYASLASKYIIRSGEGEVIAEPRDLVPEITPSQAISSRMTLPNLESNLEIVGAVITHKIADMFFPDADSSDENLVSIYSWSSKNGYHIIKSDVGITLTKNEPGDIEWKPAKNDPPKQELSQEELMQVSPLAILGSPLFSSPTTPDTISPKPNGTEKSDG